MAQGDFGVEVPTEGSDEFASLGIQFNEMARQLERRLEELEIERKRLRAAIQRVGQSFGKTLERGALLEIAVQTAVDGVGAYAGRAALRTESHGRFEEIAGRGRRQPLPRRHRRGRGGGARRRDDRRDGARRRPRALAPAARAGQRPDPRHALGRPRRREVHRRRARAVRLSRRPGGRLDRERRPARHRQAPGGHRRADRALQPPPLPGGHRQRGRANQARRRRGWA